MAAHNFNFSGGEILTAMGASWFVSYAYYERIDRTHRNWDRVSTYPSRITQFGRSEKYHESWLREVLNMNSDKLETNSIGLTAYQTKTMARALLDTYAPKAAHKQSNEPSTEDERRKYRCCFAGNQPEKLNFSERKAKKQLTAAIEHAIEDGFTTFITGMARGVDIWAGETVLIFKKENPEIKLVTASPYKEFEKKWSPKWQKRYNALLNQADAVRYICSEYSIEALQERNEWMVDRSARVIAFYDGEAGETQNTIHYAAKCGVPVAALNGQTSPFWKGLFAKR